MTGAADPRRRPGRLPGWATSVENLNPGAFAFVMATGIVSTALAAEGLRAISAVLLVVGIAGYLALWAAYAWRLVRRRQRVVRDLAGPQGFAFLTVVAASNVLASRLVAGHRIGAAAVLLAVGTAGWLVLGYGIPLLLITAGRPCSRSSTFNVNLGEQVNGTWFVWVVGTESVAVAAASLAHFVAGGALAGFASVCWAVGLLQYVLTAGMVLARLLLHQVTPRELIPPYWVFMGAAAISVLAGAKIRQLPPQENLLPPAFTLGLSMLLWAFCTWFIPLLLALGAWRHLLRRVPLRYETGLWSMVFPLGMYGVATRELGDVSGRGWLVAVGHAETYVAAVVWAVVFLAMFGAPLQAVRRPSRRSAGK